MRGLGAIVGLAAGLAGTADMAAAADLPRVPADFSLHYSAVGQHAGVFVIYDSQPGVAVRPYWRAPWRHRHYYPATGEQPDIGRDEDLSARDEPQPAESYRRFWSTSSAFLPQLPHRERAIDAEPPAPAEPALK